MKSTFRIAEISFGQPSWDKTYSFDFNGAHFEVQVFSANYSVEVVARYIKQFRNKVDAFALTNLPPIAKLEQKSYVHKQYLEIMSIPSNVPVCDGAGFREVGNLASLLKEIKAGTINPQGGVFFPVGMYCTELEEYIRLTYPNTVHIGDAYSMFGVPLVVKPFKGLMTISKLALAATNNRKLADVTPMASNQFKKVVRAALTSQVDDLQYVVGDLKDLLLFENQASFIRGKDVVVWSQDPQLEAEVQRHNPRRIINLFPEKYRISENMNYSILDAALRLTHKRSTAFSMQECEEFLVDDEDVLQITRQYVSTRKRPYNELVAKEMRKVRKKVLGQDPPDFAFIVHALSYRDLMRAPAFKALKYVPKKYSKDFEKALVKIPPFVYGEVKHVISQDSGKEVNGIIYALAATPRALREADPELIYKKIQYICNDSARRGAKILGLGAYIKVIGDQGVTINRNSPIPVTTGNSLSTSSTLWALAETVKKLGLVQLSPVTGKVDGMAMVIGATGSIGQAAAKLLSLAFNKLCIVAPRQERLDDLKLEISKMAPDCEVITSTNANEVAHLADAIVTATSAYDQKIVDIMKFKPGAVVCDCSRPLDFSFDDVKLRPDILVIESGEVILPGPVDMNFDLGLANNAVYACLAETALLAMEEKYEPFTIGRDIEWSKVKEIHKLAIKHGVQLADIQGHMGSITDKEIELVRKIALERKGSLK